MKRVTLQIFSVFLVVALLVNTAGITVFYHFCDKEGVASLSFVQEDNCCAGEKHVQQSGSKKHACCKKNKAENNFKKNTNCCSKDTFAAQWKINEFSFFKKIIFINQSLVAAAFFTIQNSFSEKVVLVAQFESPPKFKSSRDILNSISVLRI